jgi:chromosome partitioning protein
MTKIAENVAFVNHKGGTGKTTSCISIAGFLAKEGNNVLVVDLDPQANATSGLGIDVSTQQFTIYDAILDQCDGYEGVSISQIVVKTGVDNLHLAPSEFDLAVSEIVMQRAKNRAEILIRALEPVRFKYDYILIDLPPSSGLLSINGLCAANQVVAPFDPSIFSLESIGNLQTVLDEIKEMNGHSISKITTVLTRYKNPTFISRLLGKDNPSGEVEAMLREQYNDVFIVPETIKVYEAQKAGIPISHYAPESLAGKAYAKITKSLINSAEKKTENHQEGN